MPRTYRSHLAALLDILRYIRDAPQSANKISNRLHINYNNLIRDLTELSEADLVSVSVSQGTRFYGCTEKGRRLLSHIDECTPVLESLGVKL